MATLPYQPHRRAEPPTADKWLMAIAVLVLLLALGLAAPAISLLFRAGPDAGLRIWYFLNRAMQHVVLPPLLSGLAAGLTVWTWRVAWRNGRSRIARVALILLALSILLLSLHLAACLVANGHRRTYIGSGGGWRCNDELREVGRAVVTYVDMRGRPPADLEQAVVAVGLAPDILVCPYDPAKGAGHLEGSLPSSFVYMGAQAASLRGQQDASSIVLAYEDPAIHGQTGLHVVYGDYSVQWIKGPGWTRVLNDLRAGRNPPRTAGERGGL